MSMPVSLTTHQATVLDQRAEAGQTLLKATTAASRAVRPQKAIATLEADSQSPKK